DPSGAVIVGARVEITSGQLPQAIVLSTDGEGKFQSPDLKSGKYQVRVTHEGFAPLVKVIDLPSASALQLTLSIAEQKVRVTVAGKSMAFANSDPVYRQLREIGFGQAFELNNFKLDWDVGTFEFTKGTLTFLNPVNGIVTGAIFIGEGHFSLSPV